MKREQILAAIKSLAQSQGFYGRLLQAIYELKESDPDAYEEAMQNLEAQEFNDALSMVLYFES